MSSNVGQGNTFKGSVGHPLSSRSHGNFLKKTLSPTSVVVLVLLLPFVAPTILSQFLFKWILINSSSSSVSFEGGGGRGPFLTYISSLKDLFSLHIWSNDLFCCKEFFGFQRLVPYPQNNSYIRVFKG